MKRFATVLLCVFAALCIRISHSELIVELYEKSRFKGVTDRYNIQDPCHDIVALRGEVTGVKLLSGSCVVLYDQHRCTGREHFINYLHHREVNLVDTEFNDITASMSACHTRQSNIQCPEGTYVKSIYDDTANRRGVILECYTPSQIEVKALFTHGYRSTGVGGRGQCTGALRGIQFTRDTHLGAIVRMTPLCFLKANLTYFPNERCRKGQAVCGLNATIESNTEVIKSANVICCDVPDPASCSNPSDEFNVIATLDNMNGLSPTKFKYIKTVGVSISNKTGEIGSREEKFYAEFGFSLEASSRVLSASFQNNLGYSKTTGLRWSVESDQTWNVQTTTEVELEVPAGIRTTLFQVIGTCSFYKVYSSTVRREDNPNILPGPKSTTENITSFPNPEPRSMGPWYKMYHWEIVAAGVVLSVLFISFLAYKLKVWMFDDKHYADRNRNAAECGDLGFDNSGENDESKVKMFGKNYA